MPVAGGVTVPVAGAATAVALIGCVAGVLVSLRGGALAGAACLGAGRRGVAGVGIGVGCHGNLRDWIDEPYAP